MTDKRFRLDDIYKMTAHIYAEQNVARTTTATFSHFVEVCGMLTAHDRSKRREVFTVTDALCKALGWYFPLLAKMRIKSAEEVIFRKFPFTCPYCRQTPHVDAICKQVRGLQGTVNHDSVNEMYRLNYRKMPTSLDEWQDMFQQIYPRSLDDRGRSTIGLLEELGELGEAIRVFEKHPKYFIGEAADTFSYLMGIANEHKLRLQAQDSDFSFEDEYLKRYPGLCTQCGSRVCMCPAVPEATVGRMAKELDIKEGDDLFFHDPETFSQAGKVASQKVLEISGGYPALAARFPFDRGDANHALSLLCLRIADLVQDSLPDFAERVRGEVMRIVAAATGPGSRRKGPDVRVLLDEVVSFWRTLDAEQKTKITSGPGDLVDEIAQGMGTIPVLYVACSPHDEVPLRVSGELRTIREAIRLGSMGNNVVLEELPSATVDDFRRALLSNRFEVVHFSGHADEESLYFETEHGHGRTVALSAVSDLVRRYPGVKCLILNACRTLKNLSVPIAPITIGMDDTIDDVAAIEFSRGFYDALSAGKPMEFAFDEGISSVKLKGLDASMIRRL